MQGMSFRSAQADRWPRPSRAEFIRPARPTGGRRPFEARIHPACPTPSVGLRRREECLSGRRRPTVGRRPFVPMEIGLLGRLRAKRRPSPTRRMSFRSAQADRRPEAFVPIEIGLLRRLRAKRRPSPTRRMSFRSACADRWPRPSRAEFIRPARPTGGRRPLEAGFIRRAPRRASAFADAKNVFPVGAGRPLAEGFRADGNRPSEALRAGRRPSPTRRMSFRSAQADRWPEAFSGRIHSACQADRWPKAFRGRIHSTGGSQDGGEGDAAGHRGIPG